jgi:hypothetical protein
MDVPFQRGTPSPLPGFDPLFALVYGEPLSSNSCKQRRYGQILANKRITPNGRQARLIFLLFYLYFYCTELEQTKCQSYVIDFDWFKRFWGLTCDLAEVFEEKNV